VAHSVVVLDLDLKIYFALLLQISLAARVYTNMELPAAVDAQLRPVGSGLN